MGDFNDAFMRNNNATMQARTKAQNRANVMQLKLEFSPNPNYSALCDFRIGQSHPTGLTNNLLKLFEPRPPLEFKPPPEKRKCPQYTGMAHFVSNFAEKGDPEYQPPVRTGETPGIHLDPSIYLMNDENKLPTEISPKVEEPNSLFVAVIVRRQTALLRMQDQRRGLMPTC